MPAALERKLKAEAAQHKGWSKERKAAYVYGTMRKTGWKPGMGKDMGSAGMLGPMGESVVHETMRRKVHGA